MKDELTMKTEYKKVFTKDIVTEYKKKFKPNFKEKVSKYEVRVERP